MITPAAILEAVSSYYGIRVRDMRAPGRWSEWVLPRHVAMYLIRDLTGMSYPRIGSWLGGRDHVTVMRAMTKIHRLVDVEGEGFEGALARDVAELRALLVRAGASRPTSEVGSVPGIGNGPDARAA